VATSPTTEDLHGVTGSASAVYAVGDSMTVVRNDGVAWSTLRTGTAGTFDAVCSPAAGEVIVAGPDGIFHGDGSSLTIASSVGARALFSADATHAWAVGEHVQHWTNGAWTNDDPLFSGSLTSVSGTSDEDVYAVGSSPRHRGTAWSHGPFADGDLTGVFAAHDLGVMAVGPNGKIEHWSGTIVERLRARVTADLHAVVAAGHVVFIAGDDGTLQTLIFHR